MIRDLEVWLCWACGMQFEVWWIEKDHHCPHCGARNYQDSKVINIEVEEVKR